MQKTFVCIPHWWELSDHVDRHHKRTQNTELSSLCVDNNNSQKTHVRSKSPYPFRNADWAL